MMVYLLAGVNYHHERSFRKEDVLKWVVANTLLGLHIHFWMANATRFLLGSMNGVLGPIKAYASELVHDEYHVLALSTVSTS
ncbi:Protein ZINC INDUCED FACILITATOR-LIKE 1 [Orobanche minor]